MVVGAFPAVKLAVLLFKQISKPIANYAKERAKNNAFFRTYICMPPAQFYNWCEVKSKMWIMNLGKPVSVPPLNEQMAIELGANILGEGIIFILGAAVLIVEYNRSAKKEAAKEKERVDEMNKLIDTVNELYFSSQMLSTKLREMERMVVDMEPPKPYSHPEDHPPSNPDPITSSSDTDATSNDEKTRVVTKPWSGKVKSDSEGPPPPPGAIQAPLEPLKVPEIEEVPKKPKKEKVDKTTVPYPEKNLVMKSLNYVELDVRKPPASVIQVDKSLNNIVERKPSFLMNALSYLETDVKGLLT